MTIRTCDVAASVGQITVAGRGADIVRVFCAQHGSRLTLLARYASGGIVHWFCRQSTRLQDSAAGCRAWALICRAQIPGTNRREDRVRAVVDGGSRHHGFNRIA